MSLVMPSESWHKKAQSVLALVILGGSSLAVMELSVGSANASRPSVINLKALLITDTNDYYTIPYGLQEMESLMRNWGIAFDVMVYSSVTAASLWDPVNHVPKYQYIVIEGVATVGKSVSYTAAEANAVTAAVNNGTNLFLVGSVSTNLLSMFFGITSTVDCPTASQEGGNCAAETTYESKVNTTFAEPLRDTTTWKAGTVISETYSAGDNIAVMELRPRTPTPGVEELLSFSVNGTTYPAALFKKYGTSSAMVWWEGGPEGPYSSYRDGWTYIFQESEGGATMQPFIDMFYYAMNNITRYDVSVMPWGTDGSAQVIRIADHISLGQSCDGTNAIRSVIENGLQGEINVNLNGISGGMPLRVSSTQPSGVTNPQGTAGFRYWGTLDNSNFGEDSANHFELTAVVHNMTYTTNGAVSNTVTTSHTITVPITDGNTTTINSIRVLTGMASAGSWTLSFKDSKGNVLWTSNVQTKVNPAATWVEFNNINFSGGLTGYVNNLQGNDHLTLTVSSGTVNWYNQTSTQADYVVLGRSNWDIVYTDNTGTGNFASVKPQVPDSVRMANGNLYEADDQTITISGVIGEIQPADIVRETNADSPTSVNMQRLFTVANWKTPTGQSTITSCEAEAAALDWSLIPNGYTHTETVVGSHDNDFYYGNGTEMGAKQIISRVNSIISYFNAIFGTNVGTMTSTYAVPSWVKEWAFGTSFYSVAPAMQELSADEISFVLGSATTQNGFLLGGYNAQSGTAVTCTSTSCTPYTGNIYDIPERDGGKNPNMTWALGFNTTRESFSISETYSDWNYPTSDYLTAKGAKLTQQYDLSSTTWTTNYDATKFWNATLYMLTHVTTFQYRFSTGAITFTGNTGASDAINNAAFHLPLVFRLPESFQSAGLTNASDSRGVGYIANSTANWRYYQVNTGVKTDTFTFTYSEPKTSVIVTTSPSGLTNSLIVDSVEYTSPQTFTWYVNSVHDIAAVSSMSCGSFCIEQFSSWSDSGAQAQTYTVSGTVTLTATYVTTSTVTTVTQPLELTANSGGPQTFTISGCGPSSRTISGDGTVYPITMSPSCSFAVVGVSSGGLRWGFTSSGSFYFASVMQTTCASGTCADIELVFSTQAQLTVTGGYSVSVSISSETGDSWYKYGDTLTVSSRGAYNRVTGTGTRVTSWNIDGGSSTNVATTGTVTTSVITMSVPHAVTFNTMTQYQLTFVNSPSNGGTSSATTNPPISGDTGWYDSGKVVQISESANSGYAFSVWLGTGSGSHSGAGGGSIFVMMKGTIIETAIFNSTTTSTSSITPSGGGSGISELPFQPGIALLVAFVIVTAYALARRTYRIGKHPLT